MHSKLFQIKCFNVFALVTINHSSPPHMMLSYRPSSSSSPPRHYQRHPQLASTNYTNYCNNLIGKIPFYYKVRESQVRLYNNFPQNTMYLRDQKRLWYVQWENPKEDSLFCLILWWHWLRQHNLCFGFFNFSVLYDFVYFEKAYQGALMLS